MLNIFKEKNRQFFLAFHWNRFYTILVLCLFYCTVLSCESTSHREERLARTYCGNCHVFPDPSLLDKTTWESSVLPQMAFRMGIGNTEILWDMPEGDHAQILKTLPPVPMVSEEEWRDIQNYFTKNAPDSIQLLRETEIDTMDQFSPRALAVNTPYITVIKTDTISHKTYVGTRRSMLYTLDRKLNLIDSMALRSAPSHIQFEDDGLLISLMGIMDPNDQAVGELVKVDMKSYSINSVISKIQRPVYFVKEDFNNDGKDDIVLCAFGNFTGALQLVKIADGNSFHIENLNSSPGARKIVTTDFNSDGLTDVLALMTQGDERLVLYTNKGRSAFDEKVLLRFPPVHGSNYFELADFNKDGHQDILYTNGDNADFSPVLKPYHGVKIFMNDGNNGFKESWSFSMYGACQASAADFDGDGDLDIAAISFFPDFKKHPEQGFLYFENMGDNKFKPQKTFSAAQGRWLVMETSDFDNDSDIDIMLGALNFKGLGIDQSVDIRWKEKTPILLLENKLHAPK